MGVIDARQQNVSHTKCKNCRSEDHVAPEHSSRYKNSIRLAYYGCFFVLCTILVVQIGNCIDLYVTKPTYTSSHLVPQYHAEFPALSICSSSHNFKEDILKVCI